MRITQLLRLPARQRCQPGFRFQRDRRLAERPLCGADSWKDPASRDHGGGSVWTPLSLDAEKGVLYVPVGNPAPDFYGQARPGDNLYTNSLVALDVKTGKLLWFRQFVPGDVN